MKALSFFVLLFVISLQAWAGPINRNLVLFGFEFTFQDEVIITETGRRTGKTPYKAEKAENFAEAYRLELGLTADKVYNHAVAKDYKEGYGFITKNGHHYLSMEPVTIEVNPHPLKFKQILAHAHPIFAAAENVDLVPYVQPVAERSGMGHVHAGAAVMTENPFFIHPRLLRNLLVYTHKHPSLLHGFAEAFDMGPRSNIVSFHSEAMQKSFQKVIQKYDDWWEEASKEERNEGLFHFLENLPEAFFNHYQYINLEHIRQAWQPSDTGQLTVEWRNFRPQKTPEHAVANAELILDLLDFLAQKDFVEDFEWVDQEEYESFFTASAIEADWQKVKKQIGHKNRLSDAQIKELTNAIRTDAYSPQDGVLISPAYSQRTRKGLHFEIRLEQKVFPEEMVAKIGRKEVTFQPIKIGAKKYWLGHFFLKSERDPLLRPILEQRAALELKPLSACGKATSKNRQ